MDFSLTPTQLKEQEDIKEWASSVLNDGLAEREKNYQFNFDGWRRSIAKKLPGLIVPERYNGRDLDPISLAAIFEALGNGSRDNGFNFALNAHLWGCVHPVNIFGNDAQKQKYLPLLAGGEWIGALAASERDAGSDIFSLQTKAVKKHDCYVLNGSKMFVTNAPVTDLFVILAATNPSAGAFGLTAFLVEKDHPGLQIGKNLKKMGLHTAQMSEIFFEECVISAENRLGAEGAGMGIFNQIMEWERGFIMATAVGTMERQIASCILYAQNRKQFQKKIGSFTAISDKLIEMRLRWETSRLFLYKFAWLKKQGLTAMIQAAMNKLKISESWIKVSEDALKIHGGYGYLKATEVERDLRDALGSQFYSGTPEMQKQILTQLMKL